MDTIRICPQCQKPLSPEAPQGLCPACLGKVALPSEATTFVGAGGGDPPTRGLTSAAQPEPPTPASIAAHFPQLEILELLGMGGMGMVYKARQPQLDRLVALKILLPEIAAKDAAFAERFLREARALARLSHPNIVAVFDFGQAGGLYYFIMEYVDGANLRQLLANHEITPREALSIVPKVCDALQFAHDEGVMHRDIKPENILIDRKGRVRIADFGLAKLLGVGQSGVSNLTHTGVVMGTPRYMAPEQIEKPQTVDHRADIYSLGVVFYEMLTGELPIGRFEPPSHKIGVDVRLDEVVLRSLEKKPERRYQQAGEIKTDVESIVGQPIPSVPRVEGAPPSLPVPVSAAAREGSVRPRFSRRAIVGAAWAAFALAVPLWFLPVSVRTKTGGEEITVEAVTPDGTKQTEAPRATLHEHESPRPTGPAWWQWLLLIPLVSLGATAPFGTTLLGAVALHDIRHSRGHITGLPLALADTLFFPLLIFDAATFFGWYLIVNPIFEHGRRFAWTAVHHAWLASQTTPLFAQAGAPVAEPSVLMGLLRILIVFVLPLVVLLVLNGLVVYYSWRAANKAVAAFSGLSQAATMSPLSTGVNPVVERAVPQQSVGATDHPGRSPAKLERTGRRLLWLAAGALLVVAGIAAALLRPKSEPIFYTFAGRTEFVRGPGGPVLSKAFIRKMGFAPLQVEALNKIVQNYHREYVSLERQHTDVRKDERGHVRVRIAPFQQDSWALLTRMVNEIRGVVGKETLSLPAPGQLHSIGLFRHAGEAEVTAELWKEGATYHFEEQHGMRPIPGGSASLGSRGASGKSWERVFPEEYWIYWKEQ